MSSARREKARREEVERLDAEALEAIGRGWEDPLGEDEFDRLAREIFAHQFRFNPVYGQFCALRGVAAPADVETWSSIPPVPTGAFKVGRWAAFPESCERAAFETSGTTSGTCGVHRFESLALYNAAIIKSARRFLVPEDERLRCLFLSPSPAAAPRSSLVHMFAVYREAFGGPGSDFFVSAAVGGGLDLEGFTAALSSARREGDPVLVAGAALAFHHALDALGTDSFPLPRGSRSLITGGFKGAVRSASPETMIEAIESRLGIPPSHQVEEYGMTELSTQYYTDTVRSRASSATGFRIPPWARVRVVEPESGALVPRGQCGALVHFDLANRGSAVAVQTSDLGVALPGGGIQLEGREPGAEARGCSLAAELWLDPV